MKSILFALMVSLLGPTPTVGQEKTRLRIEPYRFEASDGKRVDAEIGTLLVPENRSRRDSRTIRLRFVRFRSTARQPGSPIVYLAGGPGGSGISAARGGRFPLFMALREFADVIAFDQRGTGMSEPSLGCNESFAFAAGEPLDRAKAGAIMADATRRCAERLRRDGVDIAGYTTKESVADLEDLRTALGAKKLTLWGISYGTFLALAMLKEHESRIDRLILAGIECLDCTYKAPSDQQKLLEEIARLAGADPDIRARIPDLLASIRTVLDELDRQPKTVVLAHPKLSQPVSLTLGKLDLQFVLAQMLTGPDDFAVLPDLIGRLEQGDWMALALLAGQSRVGRAPSVMSVAMDCVSGLTAAAHHRGGPWDAAWRRDQPAVS